MSELLANLIVFGLSLAVVAGVLLALFLINRWSQAFYAERPAQQHYQQLLMVCISLIGIVLMVLLMPVGDEMRGQLLSFLGILLSATIALSSTTLVGNAMAGIMLRILHHCHVGDYISVGDHFGRISKMDLLSIEIQTEDRDLTTLPNLFAVTNPLKVLRNSGTFLHVDVSLGYDIGRKKVEEALLDAAERTELIETPFVQITGLNDFSVVYRISGLLTDVSKLIQTRRKLRANTMDALHDAGIEIVSPTYMSTRQLPPGSRIVPEFEMREAHEDDHPAPDEVVFDKAHRAEELEALKKSYTEASQRLLELEQALKDAGQGEERRPLNLEKKKLEAAMARTQRQIDAIGAELNGANKVN